MNITSINSPFAPSASGGYSQAIEIKNPQRWLLVSGQIPETKEGHLASDFAGQCRQVWRNIEAQLRSAEMSLKNIVKVTTYLGSREHAEQNGAIRREVLGDLKPALTVIIAGIYDPAWLVEIEVIACA